MSEKSRSSALVPGITFALIFGLVAGITNQVYSQTSGLELHNNAMPASAGMAGTSITRPQDFLSGINGNPATLTQFEGTQFTFGGIWIEPTVNLTQSSRLPILGISPFTGKSQAQGSALGNIGVIQDLSFLGIDGKIGYGFLSNAGLSADYRHISESSGSQLTYLALDTATSLAIRLTRRLSIGGTAFIGTSLFDGPFSRSSSVQSDYALRGSIGLNYELDNGFSVGTYWQSEKKFTFDSLTQPFGVGPFTDLTMEHPSNIGVGIANNQLLNGRLLLALDVLFKNHAQATTLNSLYGDQLVVQTGAQFIVGPRLKLRTGYAWQEIGSLQTVPGSIAGIVPVGGIPAVQYLQGMFASVNQHRVTGGIQIADIMPRCDLDLSFGGMFEASENFGATQASVESYWIAFGLTWRLGGTGCSQCENVVEASSMNSDLSQLTSSPTAAEQWSR